MHKVQAEWCTGKKSAAVCKEVAIDSVSRYTGHCPSSVPEAEINSKGKYFWNEDLKSEVC